MRSDGLDRFVIAQNPVMETVLGELAAGRKRTHWMWFVFPQLRALGRSETALRYGLQTLTEAQAYAEHAMLGARLRACAELMLSHSSQHSAVEILGAVDAQKLRSCMTLFDRAAPNMPVWGAVLSAFYDAHPCARTLDLLE